MLMIVWGTEMGEMAAFLQSEKHIKKYRAPEEQKEASAKTLGALHNFSERINRQPVDKYVFFF